MNELNEVIKAKDDEIARLKEELQSAREEADNVKVDYEQLKNVLFKHAERADDAMHYKPIYDRSEYSLYTGKWMGASDLLEKAGLMDEYNRKDWK